MSFSHGMNFKHFAEQNLVFSPVTFATDFYRNHIYSIEMLKAYKYRIYPTPSQAELLNKQFGCVRFVYNWALARKLEAYKDNKKSISRFALDKELTKLKQEHEWLKEVAAQSLQQALIHLDKAFTAFFKSKNKFPKFKSKHDNYNSTNYPQSIKVDFEANKVQVPKLGQVKAKLSRNFEGVIKTSTISRTPTDKYFISILVDTKKQSEKLPDIEERAIGIDLGISHYATLSNGCKIENPRRLCQHEKRLAVLQARLAKKVKGTFRYRKAKLAVAKQHELVANARRDFQNKLSRELVNNFDTLCFEDLNVKGMLKNDKLAKCISDVAWGRFKEMCEYKVEWEGKHVRTIGRFEPSSKLCNKCYKVNEELTLKERVWTCPNCSAVHDRDVLAANNIKAFAYKSNDTGQDMPSELMEMSH